MRKYVCSWIYDSRKPQDMKFHPIGYWNQIYCNSLSLDKNRYTFKTQEIYIVIASPTTNTAPIKKQANIWTIFAFKLQIMLQRKLVNKGHYRLQGKVMFSEASVILSTIGLMATRSLLILVTAQSIRILLECFLVTTLFWLGACLEFFL